jgi:DNA helicase II / ATP-dependent DNA helicase PcrA
MPEKLLNSKQKQAIEFGNGPLLIIAGAGTGKTTVITQRIKYLITEKEISTNNILALTFTDKSSFEMQERVDILMPYGYTNIWIHTFHSFCERILRDDAYQIGLDPNFKLISESESILLLKQNIFGLGLDIFRPLGNPTKFLDALLSHYSRLKDEDITPEEYIRFARSQKSKGKNQNFEAKQYLELANAYKKYEELKVKNSLMDFSDLISNTLLLFRKRQNILKRYQEQFKYILVDEFQDTNFAQNELAILIAGKRKNITVVADDDQSIYRFRGAAVSNVLQFKKSYPKAKIITLIDNYRSTQKILNSAYMLIQNNNPNRLEVVEKINKKLISHSKSKEYDIEVIHEKRAEDEAEKIAETINVLVKKKYSFKDIAILVRANNHSDTIISALVRKRIPYQFLGPGYLFQQEEIKDLISYLIFLTNPSDSTALFRILSMEIFGISYIELIYLFNLAKKKNISLFEAINLGNLEFLKSETQVKLEKIIEMINRHIERSKKDSAGQILYYFLVDSGIYSTLQKTDSIKEERRVQNIAKFFDRIKTFETDRKETNIFTVVDWLGLMLQIGDSPTAADIDIRDRNAVNILTVHSSKGLEFKVVFLINLVSDRFPSRERGEKIPLPQDIIKEKFPKETDFHLEEERRLFYVGMTRAMEKLYFSYADFYASGKRPRKTSLFIFEALPKLKELEKINVNNKQLSLSSILSDYVEKKEIEEKKPALKIEYVTYSNLQMFDICPLHYKAKVIFNIPTPKTNVQSFGISLHNCLYKFYKLIQENKKVDASTLQNILKTEWINEGYENKTHEKERFNQAEGILKSFYKSEEQLIKPIGLELPFSFNLKNGIRVSGKIDRVDRRQKGIEIIDYKTGQDNPKAKTAHELQLAIYALAATKVKDEVFNRKPEDITLTLHFLEGNTKKHMNFTQSDLDKFENELIEKIKEIEKSDFKCSGNVLCLNCEFKILCSA